MQVVCFDKTLYPLKLFQKVCLILSFRTFIESLTVDAFHRSAEVIQRQLSDCLGTAHNTDCTIWTTRF